MTTPLESRFQDAKPLYSESEARIEANRCLYCYDAPCVKACPVGIDIPGFIQQIASRNIRGAAKTILQVNPLGLSTSRVCPVEELCAGACVYHQHDSRPINIGRLQRYATEQALHWEMSSGKTLFTPEITGDRKVALIGAGPASISCAAYLAMAGVHPVIFEKDDKPGGLVTTGIAPYKLQSLDAVAEIEWLVRLGIEIRTGVTIGSDVTVDQLLTEYDALFVGTGLGKDTFPGIDGETETGVWGATELIRRIKADDHFQLPDDLNRVIIIGGGNTAIDIAHELALLGVPQVDIIYRRTVAEMPGYQHELVAARKSGVRMIEKAKPLSISRTSDGDLALNAEHTTSGEQIQFTADWIVMAIGQAKVAGRLIPQIETDNKGLVIVDPLTRRSSHPKIYAGGDCINGGKEVVNAVADGREAAFAMLKEFEKNGSRNG
ncbi:MAG: FAD-dependent oxidoreductase [Candidatus Marinimicrobia bacterium]|nr:FAD-dependent oxidoreductase [Candidatus Neomarinimicrobiota bacterium]